MPHFSAAADEDQLLSCLQLWKTALRKTKELAEARAAADAADAQVATVTISDLHVQTEKTVNLCSGKWMFLGFPALIPYLVIEAQVALAELW